MNTQSLQSIRIVTFNGREIIISEINRSSLFSVTLQPLQPDRENLVRIENAEIFSGTQRIKKLSDIETGIFLKVRRVGPVNPKMISEYDSNRIKYVSPISL